MSASDHGSNSRRKFLQSAAAAGAGLTATWPTVVSATATRPDEDIGGPASPRQTMAGPSNRFEVVAAAERALGSLLANGVDPNFPTPFEAVRVQQDTGLRRECIARAVNYIMTPEGRSDAKSELHVMRMPKMNLFGYRYFAHVDLEDALCYLTVAILIATRLEASKRPDDEQKVFSHRFLGEGPEIFDADCDYGLFLDRTLEKLQPDRRTFLVSADIANFYPSINDARLVRNLVTRNVEPWLADALQQILLQWKHGWRQGVPVGPFASHLIAEAVQSEVDAKLTGEGVDFIRYVDDYRIFVDDLASARAAVARLADHLQAESLTLNQSKTTVEAVTRDQYAVRLSERRMMRFWNQTALPASFQTAQAPSSSASPPKKKTTPAPKQKKKAAPPCPYNRCTPFKKSQLDELDIAFLEQVDPAVLLARLQKQAADAGLISLGDFRALIESAIYRDYFALIGKALPLLDGVLHGVIYLADVLINQGERIPAVVRGEVADWFAGRLLTRWDISDHEVMNIALVLGSDGYRRSAAIHAYLESENRTTSAVAVRSLLEGLRGECDAGRVAALLRFAASADQSLRRAVFDLCWPCLDDGGKKRLAFEFGSEFSVDPFLRRLIQGTARA